MRAVILLCAFVLTVVAQNPTLIKNLPGLGEVNFNMYSGYIPVSDRKQLFYWFVESSNSPRTDPLILWLNGGPGCSSLGGLLSENGPFSPDAKGNLIPNPHSWNNYANVLYLESPAGVGFSDYGPIGRSDDNSTADDTLLFLQNWFVAYPRYQQNDFYITGESYAGHYIPTLVYRIANASQINPQGLPQRNFRGFMVGNPLVDWDTDLGTPLLMYYQYHGMIQLGDNNGNPLGNYNPYDILTDVCSVVSIRNRVQFSHPLFMNDPKERHVPNPPPCIDDYVSDYLNRPDVQTAIHARGKYWRMCGGIDYRRADERNSMIPYFNYIMDNTNYKVIVYSGDADTVLSFAGTQTWILNLGRPVTSPWNAWIYNQKENGQQVGGWYIEFDRITFLTVKGAGHMVPWFQPAPAAHLLNQFLLQNDGK